jgi:glucosamine--fructose-6-phosphate aminotransferase (isomerizing)
MCGIVGYVGADRALPFLLAGLRSLEYRGYDSAGVALVERDGIRVRKVAGRLERLVEAVRDFDGTASCGIGHTRWATHGPPTDDNAHPHTDCTGRVAAVHNGIIENYRALREWLTARGHRFRSETDTEVIPHLLEEHLKTVPDLAEAAQAAMGELEGAYAFLAVSADDPGTLVAVREASPLVIGVGTSSQYVASDLPALLPYTRRALILENGEMAVVRREGVSLRTRAGDVVTREPLEVTWTAEQASRGGYPHYMLKEIHEQPDAWADCLRGRIDGAGRLALEEFGLLPGDLEAVGMVQFVAAGTAYHAALVGAHLVERLARIPTRVDVASEFRYRDPIWTPGAVVVAVSQSGETADTLASVRLAKSRGVPVWAVTNVVGSTLAREADRVLYTRAGPEVAVASTKAYTTQLLVLTLLAHALAETVDRPTGPLLAELMGLPHAGAAWLEADHGIRAVAERIRHVPSLFYIGRGVDYALALEGQLKLKEISYIHAEAYPAGELKHGTLALIEPGVPVVAVVSGRNLLPKVHSNIQEVKARGAWVVGITTERLAAELQDVLDVIITVPDRDDRVMPALVALPLQLLAYETAVARGLDVDKPRNLAKSVTVE